MKSAIRIMFFGVGITLLGYASGTMWGLPGVAMVFGFWFVIGLAFDLLIEAIRGS